MRFNFDGRSSSHGVWSPDPECTYMFPEWVRPNRIYRYDEGETSVSPMNPPFSSDTFVQGRIWDMVWKYSNSATKYRMGVTYFKVPAGAADITLGTLAVSATTGQGTFTPTKEGLLLGHDGALTAAGDNADTVAGALLTDYYNKLGGFHNAQNGYSDGSEYQLTLEELDYVCLARTGEVELYVNGTVTKGQNLICANNGQLEPATDLDTSSVANFSATVREHMVGFGLNSAAAAVQMSVARTRAARTGAGLVLCELLLPRTWSTY